MEKVMEFDGEIMNVHKFHRNGATYIQVLVKTKDTRSKHRQIVSKVFEVFVDFGSVLVFIFGMVALITKQYAEAAAWIAMYATFQLSDVLENVKNKTYEG